MGTGSSCESIREKTNCFCLPISETQEDHDESEDLLTAEERNHELYIECKQDKLGVHLLHAERLRFSQKTINETFINQKSLTELEFACFLGHNKLIQHNYMTDKKWHDFYKHFITK